MVQLSWADAGLKMSQTEPKTTMGVFRELNTVFHDVVPSFQHKLLLRHTSH